MKKILVLLLITSILKINAQDSLKTNQENVKTGFGFAGVPVISYNSDLGLKYGAILNVFHYGNGKNYPNPNHKLYLEWTRTTKGSGITQLIYDSRTLFKGMRTTFEATWFKEQALQFFGFNGTESKYISDYEDPQSEFYKSRTYYRQDRQLYKLRADVQGHITNEHLRWLAGFSFNKININKVDVDELNSGITTNYEGLPDSSLFADYISWNVLNKEEIKGGYLNNIKLGLVYDTRDNDANPMKGIWDEVMFVTFPSFFGNQYSFGKFILTHRQYFTLVKKRLNFAYRVSFQPKLFGKMPFYALPFLYNTDVDRDGLGGSKTLRGIYRNRIVGEGYAFFNAEFRWKFLMFRWLKQDIYLALVPFVDGGIVTQKYKDINLQDVPDNRKEELSYKNETFHLSYGGAFAFVLNYNFIINVTYGISNDINDGNRSLYINLNYLF